MNMVRPTPYNGTSSWDAYKAQFEMLAELNSWTDAEKAMFLAINLKGSALSLLGNIPPRSRADYTTVTEALDSRFRVAHQAEFNRARLRNRRRRRDEGLPELAEDVKRLARLAHPDENRPMLKFLAKDQFIDALWNSAFVRPDRRRCELHWSTRWNWNPKSWPDNRREDQYVRHDSKEPNQLRRLRETNEIQKTSCRNVSNYYRNSGLELQVVGTLELVED